MKTPQEMQRDGVNWVTVRATEERERAALEKIEHVCSLPARFRDEQITMAHGAGGKATQQLIQGLLLPALRSEALEKLDAAGILVGRVILGEVVAE